MRCGVLHAHIRVHIQLSMSVSGYILRRKKTFDYMCVMNVMNQWRERERIKEAELMTLHCELAIGSHLDESISLTSHYKENC